MLGDRRILERAATWVGSPDLEFDGVDDPAAGRVARGGRAAVEYVFRACDLAMAGTADAVVTAPLGVMFLLVVDISYIVWQAFGVE